MRYTGADGILIKQRANSIFKEIFRKAIHLCSAAVPFLLSAAYMPVMVLLGCALVLYSVSEILRCRGVNIPVVSRITETAARKRDENRFVLGPVTLVAGIMIAALLLPLDSARIGIFALSFGDGLASLVGKLVGKVVIPFTRGKTAAGSLACYAAVFTASFLCCGNVLTALILALCATVIEILPLADFDNLVIPVAIGSVYFFFFR